MVFGLQKPFEYVQLGGAPVSIFIIWTLVVLVMASGINLISSTSLPHFKPENKQEDTEESNKSEED